MFRIIIQVTIFPVSCSDLQWTLQSQAATTAASDTYQPSAISTQLTRCKNKQTANSETYETGLNFCKKCLSRCRSWSLFTAWPMAARRAAAVRTWKQYQARIVAWDANAFDAAVWQRGTLCKWFYVQGIVWKPGHLDPFAEVVTLT